MEYIYVRQIEDIEIIKDIFEDKALAVLFRSSEDEIKTLSGLKGSALKEWLDKQDSIRWQLIKKKFQKQNGKS